MASLPAPVNPGDLIKSNDWNAVLSVVDALSKDKLDIAGGTITGALNVTGALAVGGAAQSGRVVTLRSATGAYLSALSNNDAQELLIGADGNGGIVSTMSNHDLQLRAGANSTKMIIKADGKVGIGLPPTATAPQQPIGFLLDVNDRVRLRQGTAASAGLWLYQTTPNADRAFVGMADDNTVGLYGVTSGWGLKMDVSSGALTLSGDLSVSKTTGGSATFTNTTYTNENQFGGIPNLKLSMGFESTRVLGSGLTYQFAIGHVVQINGGAIGGVRIATNFFKGFSVDQSGNVVVAGALTAGGGKGGYVIDNFINAAGDSVEQGDVIILGGSDASKYYGIGSSIPVPEVDLTDKAYDTRVCGIVEAVVTADALPPFHPQSPTEEEVNAIEGEKNARKRKKAQDALDARMEHPLQSFAAEVSDGLDTSRVEKGQLGKMVTLGAYAFCKVDADIAPIAVGDLLTTSPTKGHAQKVLEPDKAVGAIIGKALGSLKKGQGKIPVLVLLH